MERQVAGFVGLVGRIGEYEDGHADYSMTVQPLVNVVDVHCQNLEPSRSGKTNRACNV
jgi:hypothetical protein